jgi:tetratricopeptide (TPR) repeat protein
LGRVLLEKYRKEKVGDTLRRAHEAFERALDLLARAQSDDPTIFATVDDHVQANLGYAWTFLYEAEVDQIHDYQAALEVFKQVASRYPLSAEAWTSLGVAYSQMNEEVKSEQAFKKALELEPSCAEAFRGLGLLELQRGRFEEAATNLERALALRPDSLEDALLLAGALGDGGRMERAVDVAERARERHPREAGPLAILGTLAAQRGDIESASKFADRALALDPDDGRSLLLKGKVQLSRGEFTGALRTLQRAADLLPTSFEAHYNVAALFLRDRKLDEAMPYLLRAYDCRSANASGDLLRKTLLDLDLKDPDTLSKLAAIDAQHERDAQASEWIERALAVKPDHGPSHFLKGALAKKRGDLAAAAEEWRKACAAMPDSASLHESLGMLLLQMKQKAEALVHLKQSLAIASREPAPDEMQRSAVQQLRETVEGLENAKGSDEH